MTENELFALFWKCVATVVIVGFLTAGGCTARKNQIQAEVLSKAQNPAQLQCVFQANNDAAAVACLSVGK